MTAPSARVITAGYTSLANDLSTGDGMETTGRRLRLLFGVPYLVSYISQVMTLLPGDVVLTGTPSGVGPIRPGQRVVCSIEALGSLENTVTAADAVSTAGGAR